MPGVGVHGGLLLVYAQLAYYAGPAGSLPGGGVNPSADPNMDILYLLIPLSVVLVFCILGGLWWAIERGQFDDVEDEAARILDQS